MGVGLRNTSEDDVLGDGCCDGVADPFDVGVGEVWVDGEGEDAGCEVFADGKGGAVVVGGVGGLAMERSGVVDGAGDASVF